MSYEYTRFGPDILRREAGSTDDWKVVPPDDLENARVEVTVARRLTEQERLHPPVKASRIIRSEQNKEIAAKLGLTADKLAERLTDPEDNKGTLVRIPDSEFDAEMAKLGLSPQEARDRFSGKHWQS